VAERKIWFGNLSSSINNHLTLGYVRQPSAARRAAKASVAECAIRNFKKGKNTIKSRTLRKLTRAIHDLQNKNMKN
jgi:hypothetical protein